MELPDGRKEKLLRTQQSKTRDIKIYLRRLRNKLPRPHKGWRKDVDAIVAQIEEHTKYRTKTDTEEKILEQLKDTLCTLENFDKDSRRQTQSTAEETKAYENQSPSELFDSIHQFTSKHLELLEGDGTPQILAGKKFNIYLNDFLRCWQQFGRDLSVRVKTQSNNRNPVRWVHIQGQSNSGKTVLARGILQGFTLLRPEGMNTEKKVTDKKPYRRQKIRQWSGFLHEDHGGGGADHIFAMTVTVAGKAPGGGDEKVRNAVWKWLHDIGVLKDTNNADKDDKMIEALKTLDKPYLCIIDGIETVFLEQYGPSSFTHRLFKEVFVSSVADDKTASPNEKLGFLLTTGITAKNIPPQSTVQKDTNSTDGNTNSTHQLYTHLSVKPTECTIIKCSQYFEQEELTALCETFKVDSLTALNSDIQKTPEEWLTTNKGTVHRLLKQHECRSTELSKLAELLLNVMALYDQKITQQQLLHLASPYNFIPSPNDTKLVPQKRLLDIKRIEFLDSFGFQEEMTLKVLNLNANDVLDAIARFDVATIILDCIPPGFEDAQEYKNRLEDIDKLSSSSLEQRDTTKELITATENHMSCVEELKNLKNGWLEVTGPKDQEKFVMHRADKEERSANMAPELAQRINYDIYRGLIEYIDLNSGKSDWNSTEPDLNVMARALRYAIRAGAYDQAWNRLIRHLNYLRWRDRLVLLESFFETPFSHPHNNLPDGHEVLLYYLTAMTLMILGEIEQARSLFETMLFSPATTNSHVLRFMKTHGFDGQRLTRNELNLVSDYQEHIEPLYDHGIFIGTLCGLRDCENYLGVNPSYSYDLLAEELLADADIIQHRPDTIAGAFSYGLCPPRDQSSEKHPLLALLGKENEPAELLTVHHIDLSQIPVRHHKKIKKQLQKPYPILPMFAVKRQLEGFQKREMLLPPIASPESAQFAKEISVELSRIGFSDNHLTDLKKTLISSRINGRLPHTESLQQAITTDEQIHYLWGTLEEEWPSSVLLIEIQLHLAVLQLRLVTHVWWFCYILGGWVPPENPRDPDVDRDAVAAAREHLQNARARRDALECPPACFEEVIQVLEEAINTAQEEQPKDSE